MWIVVLVKPAADYTPLRVQSADLDAFAAPSFFPAGSKLVILSSQKDRHAGKGKEKGYCYLPVKYTDSLPPNLPFRCEAYTSADPGVRVRVPAGIHAAAFAVEVDDREGWVVEFAWGFHGRDVQVHDNVADGFFGVDGVAGGVSRCFQCCRREVEVVKVVVVEEANDLRSLATAQDNMRVNEINNIPATRYQTHYMDP